MPEIMQATRPLSAAGLAALAAFGISARDAAPLGGERDTNLLVRLACGAQGVLKIVTEADAAASIALQVAALRHLAQAAPALPLPRVLPAPGGVPMVRLADGAVAWMLSYLPGRLLSATAASAVTLRSLGGVCGQLVGGLRGFDHPGLDRTLIWRLSAAAEAIPLAAWVDDQRARHLAVDALTRAAGAIPVIGALPCQALHGDLNPWNVVVAEDGRVAGLIDLGDMHRGPRVAELAIAVSYHVADGEAGVAAVLDGFAAETALTAAERDLLPVLVAARLGMTIAIAHWRARQQPEAAPYLLRNVPAALHGLEWLTVHDLRDALARARAP